MIGSFLYSVDIDVGPDAFKTVVGYFKCIQGSGIIVECTSFSSL